MSAEAQRLLTGEEYLAFDRESEIRHEFVDGEIYDGVPDLETAVSA